MTHHSSWSMHESNIRKKNDLTFNKINYKRSKQQIFKSFPLKTLNTMWPTLLLIILVCFFYQKWRKTCVENIPGPKFALPLVGHLLFVGNEPHKTFLEWKKVYGPIFSVQLGHLRTVVLNDLKLIKEAFKMQEFAGRPPQEVFERACDKKGIAFVSGPGVFEQRNFFLKFVRNFCYEDRGHFESKIHDEISRVVSTISENVNQPLKMEHAFNIPAMNALWSFLMGRRFEHSDPEVKHLAQCASDYFSIEGVAANLGFFVPVIAKLFPNFTGAAKMFKGGVSLYDFIDQDWKKGCSSRLPGQPRNYKEAWMDKFETASTNSSFHPSRNYFPATMGDILLAAIETTAATIDWAIIYLARNPEHQRKLQEELEEIVGATDFITLEDRPQLPYTEAVIHEVLRISSLGPFGLLHSTTEDCHFQGFTIPDKTCVIGNLYAVHHDPEIWDSPEEFRPERFLDESNNLTNTEKIIPFSIGKRNCIGESIARDEIFLFITNILYKFNVICTEKKPDLSPMQGVALVPKPYEVMFSPRQN
ncbi:unnamed protein product [Allacma fusca]|uniref:Cytochrome P450 n=1 Tax=Allacma fusca TaxID=39272 RepID=A0A8J2JIV3_9HEXA|nr:unnamed protein product [Allacma fusca]